MILSSEIYSNSEILDVITGRFFPNEDQLYNPSYREIAVIKGNRIDVYKIDWISDNYTSEKLSFYASRPYIGIWRYSCKESKYDSILALDCNLNLYLLSIRLIQAPHTNYDCNTKYKLTNIQKNYSNEKSSSHFEDFLQINNDNREYILKLKYFIYLESKISLIDPFGIEIQPFLSQRNIQPDTLNFNNLYNTQSISKPPNIQVSVEYNTGCIAISSYYNRIALIVPNRNISNDNTRTNLKIRSLSFYSIQPDMQLISFQFFFDSTLNSSCLYLLFYQIKEESLYSSLAHKIIWPNWNQIFIFSHNDQIWYSQYPPDELIYPLRESKLHILNLNNDYSSNFKKIQNYINILHFCMDDTGNLYVDGTYVQTPVSDPKKKYLHTFIICNGLENLLSITVGYIDKYNNCEELWRWSDNMKYVYFRELVKLKSEFKLSLKEPPIIASKRNISEYSNKSIIKVFLAGGQNDYFVLVIVVNLDEIEEVKCTGYCNSIKMSFPDICNVSILNYYPNPTEESLTLLFTSSIGIMKQVTFPSIEQSWLVSPHESEIFRTFAAEAVKIDNHTTILLGGIKFTWTKSNNNDTSYSWKQQSVLRMIRCGIQTYEESKSMGTFFGVIRLFSFSIIHNNNIYGLIIVSYPHKTELLLIAYDETKQIKQIDFAKNTINLQKWYPKNVKFYAPYLNFPTIYCTWLDNKKNILIHITSQFINLIFINMDEILNISDQLPESQSNYSQLVNKIMWRVNSDDEKIQDACFVEKSIFVLIDSMKMFQIIIDTNSTSIIAGYLLSGISFNNVSSFLVSKWHDKYILLLGNWQNEISIGNILDCGIVEKVSKMKLPLKSSSLYSRISSVRIEQDHIYIMNSIGQFYYIEIKEISSKKFKSKLKLQINYQFNVNEHLELENFFLDWQIVSYNLSFITSDKCMVKHQFFVKSIYKNYIIDIFATRNVKFQHYINTIQLPKSSNLAIFNYPTKYWKYQSHILVCIKGEKNSMHLISPSKSKIYLQDFYLPLQHNSEVIGGMSLLKYKKLLIWSTPKIPILLKQFNEQNYHSQLLLMELEPKIRIIGSLKFLNSRTNNIMNVCSRVFESFNWVSKDIKLDDTSNDVFVLIFSDIQYLEDNFGRLTLYNISVSDHLHWKKYNQVKNCNLQYKYKNPFTNLGSHILEGSTRIIQHPLYSDRFLFLINNRLKVDNKITNINKTDPEIKYCDKFIPDEIYSIIILYHLCRANDFIEVTYPKDLSKKGSNFNFSCEIQLIEKKRIYIKSFIEKASFKSSNLLSFTTLLNKNDSIIQVEENTMKIIETSEYCREFEIFPKDQRKSTNQCDYLQDSIFFTQRPVGDYEDKMIKPFKTSLVDFSLYIEKILLNNKTSIIPFRDILTITKSNKENSLYWVTPNCHIGKITFIDAETKLYLYGLQTIMAYLYKTKVIQVHSNLCNPSLSPCIDNLLFKYFDIFWTQYYKNNTINKVVMINQIFDEIKNKTSINSSNFQNLSEISLDIYILSLYCNTCNYCIKWRIFATITYWWNHIIYLTKNSIKQNTYKILKCPILSQWNMDCNTLYTNYMETNNTSLIHDKIANFHHLYIGTLELDKYIHDTLLS
ncbi:uncharacterized protein CMU_031130 [Cryptosporidium muris RN66]|uniref:Uncharacterized protein n=1 Tax=Cryptosporidium muris (strain RN66) TaxID=441375 RepID=B6AID1_CRYMR|nr:uncharacterized protein CMU_031130 [Cryptosporidium muris RN66]EEA07972.1 hypothetical protein CMU_031130 [Cryptosporidium muris RN66]|eukprot:XP_002142321.1 hypothetical protein [Cryptosporidium muris RN66]